jgi:hypothetical protein
MKTAGPTWRVLAPLLAKQSPDFDARNYGFARLTDLVEASGIVDVERSGDSPKIVTVRLKGKARTKPNG